MNCSWIERVRPLGTRRTGCGPILARALESGALGTGAMEIWPRLCRHDSFVATAGFFSLDSVVADFPSLALVWASPALLSGESEDVLDVDFFASRLSLTYQ